MSHRERRTQIIKEIVATLKKANEKMKVLNYETFIVEIMTEHGASRRTARDYLAIAVHLYKKEMNVDCSPVPEPSGGF